MIGAIAHQWRQPLNTLGLIIQDIEDADEFGELDKKYLAKSVEKANNQIQYMSKTIDDFRNFFKPNKTREVFDIYKISKKALELLSAQLRNRGIKVEWGGKKQEKCEVYGYKNEFQQVVLNLITNARDAIMQRLEQNNKIQGLIKITLLEDKYHWILEFSDNGTGIKEEIIEKIFEPYFSTKSFNGTGIGLYMAKTIIINNMGGELFAKNNKDLGATFVVKLNKFI